MKRLVTLLLVLLTSLCLSGCASMSITKDMPAVQKADLVLQDIETGLTIAADARSVAVAAFPEKGAEIAAKTDAAFKIADVAVASLRDAVCVWYATGESIDAQDWAVLTASARKAVSNVVVLVAELRAEYAAGGAAQKAGG